MSEKSLTQDMVAQLVEKLRKIEEKEEYFPYFFQARMMRFSLKGFEAGNAMAPLMKAVRSLSLYLWGGLHFAQALREIVDLKLDVAAVEAGWKHIKKAESLRDGKWIVYLSTLIHATKETIAKEDFDVFEACYKTLKSKQSWLSTDKKSDKISKFGFVIQLRLLAMDGPTLAVKRKASDELLRLGGLPNEDEWLRDPDVFEALIEVLHFLRDERAGATLQSLKDVKDDRLSRRYSEWENAVVEDEGDDERKGTHRDALFDRSREIMNIRMTFKDVQATDEELRNRYLHDSFSKVTPILPQRSRSCL